MRRSLGRSDGGLGKAISFQLMASFCAHVLLFNEQLWADKPSVYRGNSAASKLCTRTGGHVHWPKSEAAGHRDQRRLPKLLQVLFGRFFQQSLLELLLALDAVARPGDRLQPLGVNLLAAVDTLAEAALANA